MVEEERAIARKATTTTLGSIVSIALVLDGVGAGEGLVAMKGLGRR